MKKTKLYMDTVVDIEVVIRETTSKEEVELKIDRPLRHSEKWNRPAAVLALKVS
ncbi:hypothetical protein NDK43_27725 [Neobacillus pocheonensis]|uniref:Uncharacterized protein n=1 Tax=Neobacillus pocheonensis TaxID=363869 RepID=A0ABT0WIR6_9BACI|nr:hypothetical protein [Neobacillus pocheonensis]